MSFAEIVLRIGAGLGGWIIFIAYALAIAIVPRADCDPASHELWIGTLAFAGVSAGAVLLLGLGLRWRESTRWFALVALPLAGYAAIGIAPALLGTSIDGAALCAFAGALPSAAQLDAYPATATQRAWPAVQLLVLALGTAQGLRYWLPRMKRS